MFRARPALPDSRERYESLDCSSQTSLSFPDLCIKMTDELIIRPLCSRLNWMVMSSMSFSSAARRAYGEQQEMKADQARRATRVCPVQWELKDWRVRRAFLEQQAPEVYQ